MDWNKGDQMLEDSIQMSEPRRSTYAAPGLHRYGGMRELTASGTGVEQEKGSAAGNMEKRP